MRVNLNNLKNNILSNPETIIEQIGGEIDLAGNKLYFRLEGNVRLDAIFNIEKEAEKSQSSTLVETQEGTKSVETPKEKEPVSKNMPPSMPTMPNIPKVPPAVQGNGGASDKPNVPKFEGGSNAPPPPPPVNSNADSDGIKDVQMLAINTLLGVNEANYKDLVKEAFDVVGIEVDTIPPLESLTYKQAIEVIKYGNDKFKK